MGAGHARSRYLNRKEGGAEGRASDWSEVVTRPRTTRSPLSFWGDGGIVPFEPFFHAFPGGLEKAAINRIFLILPSRKEEREILFPFRLEMGAGLKKDLRVSRVRPVGSLNALFFLLIEVISQILPMVRKRGGTSTLGERSTTESCMLRSGRMNRSRKGIY
ncbi:hypothetical protein Bca101_073123 [Brassica carinata]